MPMTQRRHILRFTIPYLWTTESPIRFPFFLKNSNYLCCTHPHLERYPFPAESCRLPFSFNCTEDCAKAEKLHRERLFVHLMPLTSFYFQTIKGEWRRKRGSFFSNDYALANPTDGDDVFYEINEFFKNTFTSSPPSILACEPAFGSAGSQIVKSFDMLLGWTIFLAWNKKKLIRNTHSIHPP